MAVRVLIDYSNIYHVAAIRAVCKQGADVKCQYTRESTRLTLNYRETVTVFLTRRDRTGSVKTDLYGKNKF